MTVVWRERLPEAAYAAALASLPGMGPAWLAGLLAVDSPSVAWRRVVEGRAEYSRRGPTKGLGPDAKGLSAIAQRVDISGLWSRCEQERLTVTWLGGPGYPARFAQAQPAAGVVFVAGALAKLDDQPGVAVIGTRRCTPEGADIAWRLGYDLARAGILVISGLALGIDGAAHAGALAAVKDLQGKGAGTTVGVAASGPDVVYPRQHRALWREVGRYGAILSETPPGTPAQAWRFPSRNRLIAALAQMVVVVECHASGGSWHTVDAAIRLGQEVGAVPGSVLSSASVGTNMLLHEGAVPVRSARDVLDALDLTGPPRSGHGQSRGPDGTATRTIRGSGTGPALGPVGQALGPVESNGRHVAGPVFGLVEPPLGPVESRVLRALGSRPLCLEDLVERSGLPPAPVVVALERLEQLGIATSEAGWWSRRREGGRGSPVHGDRWLTTPM